MKENDKSKINPDEIITKVRDILDNKTKIRLQPDEENWLRNNGGVYYVLYNAVVKLDYKKENEQGEENER